MHEGTTDHNLLECHRCPTQVVTAASNLIAFNRDRIARGLTGVASNGAGQINVIQYPTIEAEALGIADIVATMIAAGTLAGDILILAQSKVLARPILDRLREYAVPVKSYHEESQLDTLEAQERLATLKLLVNNEDRVALRWLLGVGHTDFRAKAYAKIRSYSEENDLSPWEVLAGLTEGTIRITYTGPLVDKFNEINQEFALLKDCESIEDFANTWLPAGLDGTEELRLLVESKIRDNHSVADLLDAVVTEVTQPEIPLEVTEVRIMSLHKSKGLSSPVVIISGCVNGLMPRNYDASKATIPQAEYLEEQRRLFYVGITRVKAKPADGKVGELILTSSSQIDLAAALQNGITPAGNSGRDCVLHASTYLAEMGPVIPRPRRG